MAKKQDKILSEALTRFKLTADAEAQIRRESEEDLKFKAGDQWPNDIQQVRDLSKRPCLTINRIPQFVRQVTNDQRMNKPSIRISPTDDSTEETAEIYEGLIRHIQYSSGADVAFDTACDFQVTIGFGYLRVNTKYCFEDSFDQEVIIEPVLNPFTVYMDPAAQKIDASDARFCFIATDMSKEEFEEMYPKAKVPDATFSSIGDLAPDWATDQTVRVAEYWRVEEKEKTIYQLSDGSVVDKLPPGVTEETLESEEEESYETLLKQVDELSLGIESLTVVNKRSTMERKIMWYKITAVEILESREWVGKYIPIVPVWGEVYNINGKKQVQGMVRAARDPQRMYNYWASAQTEAIALAPKAPFIIAEGQIEGYEEFWQNANVGTYSHLPYRPMTIDGLSVPPPIRQQAEPPIAAINAAINQSSMDLMHTTGIYQANLGQRSNETSGKAILARQHEGDVSNFHFIDNLSRAMRFLGEIILDLIPKIYDAPRVIRILHENKESELVEINKMFKKGPEAKIYDMTQGKYDIIIETGPSYTTKRKEAADNILQILQTNPEMWQWAGDILFNNMDLAGSNELAKRAKIMLPPQVQQAEEQEQNGSNIPPQIQQQLQQSQQMIEQLTQALNIAQDKIEQNTREIESKERIAAENNLTKIILKEMENNKALLDAELKHISDRLALLNSSVPVGAEQGVEQGIDQNQNVI